MSGRIVEVQTCHGIRYANYFLDRGYNLLKVVTTTRPFESQEVGWYIAQLISFIVGRPEGVPHTPFPKSGDPEIANKEDRRR